MSDPNYTLTEYLSGDRLAVSNAAGDSFVPEFAAGVRVRADCQADGIRLGTVLAAVHDPDSGRTLVDVGMDAGMPLTANLVRVLHGNDVPEALCSHAGQHAPGGRDALAEASTAVPGLVRLASATETQAGADAAKAVTPSGLAAAAKGLIAANATIHVAATGSDATGTGAVGAPYASIAKALASIAGKLIASGVTVTIQVADGTYSIPSAIVINHPDADKIQIQGNTASETTLTVGSVVAADKKFVVAGDQTAVNGLSVGDIIVVSGSSSGAAPAGLNGAYTIAARAFAGGNTEIVVSETVGTSTAGGASLKAKPCNRCQINVAGGVNGVVIQTNLLAVDGIRFNSAGGTAYAVMATNLAKLLVGDRMIANSFTAGLMAQNASFINFGATVIKNCPLSIYATSRSTIKGIAGKATVIDGASYMAVTANLGSFVQYYDVDTVLANCPATPCSPARDTVGNQNSYIASA
ncbi:hypothetical protein [Solidesulfovibrio sp.]